MKKKIIAVAGPTASGKTALSIALAKKIGGEIISCDSMQIYRGMDIGTAKPTKEEMDGVPHHLIDIVDPCEFFSAADYALLAKKKIEEIYSRGNVPIFCGGTGLYLESVVRPRAYGASEPEPGYRAELFELAAREGGTHILHEKLREVDPESADAIHENNVKRVIRALEIYRSAGVPKSRLDRASKEIESEYDVRAICLRFSDRNTLYERINKRVDKMIADGLLCEVRRLYESGMLKRSYTAAQAIGYKEFISYLDGNMSLDEAAEALKCATRRYAKRQMTWFGARDYIKYIDMDGKDAEAVLAEACEMIK